ncbi:MAG: recombinase family protein [Planctomycetota bacterium]|nr:recombinase family protein [Planctomycetota bacterium]
MISSVNGYVVKDSQLVRAALYARVSSEQQAQTGTIGSQVAAIGQRVQQDGLSIDPEMRFIDDGYMGAALIRPGLERLRDMAAAGAIDRLYVLCPDRLARKYAYQALLVDELRRCDVEVVFNQAEQPRKAYGVYDTPSDQWVSIPVPAIVEEDLFAAVAEQLEENRQLSRLRRRGAAYLLQGLVMCKCCGYAFYGKPVSPSSAKGKPRRYAYYRCVGSDAYRFGGQRVCHNKQVRTDLLEEVVWNDVRALLAEPGRIEQEFQRRLHSNDSTTNEEEKRKLDGMIRKVHRGIARLIDADGDGILDKGEFEPRIKAAKNRLAKLQAEVQSVVDLRAQADEMRLVIDNVQAFAERVTASLDSADWHAQREVIRTRVKRVEIDKQQVRVVYRVNIAPFDRSPARGSLPHCCRRLHKHYTVMIAETTKKPVHFLATRQRFTMARPSALAFILAARARADPANTCYTSLAVHA